MYKHILIATDGSELAEKALRMGLALAKAVGAKTTAVTVSEPWLAIGTGEGSVAFPFDEYERATAQAATKILASARDHATQLAVPCATVHLKAHVAEGILQAAKDRHCDLIVMASQGRRGLARLLLGSQAMHVVTHSSLPVLIYR
jgi:nucleotide-binding universal stress UspA family protein